MAHAAACNGMAVRVVLRQETQSAELHHALFLDLQPLAPAQELPHGFDERLRRRLPAEKQMAVALETQEFRVRNRGRDVAAYADGHAPIEQRMNHERRKSTRLNSSHSQ